MANYYLALVLFRIVLPIIIGICVAIRPCGISALYLIFMCFIPLVPVPTPSSMAGRTGCYLKTLIAASFLTAIAQISFQIVLLSLAPYGGFLTQYPLLEKILRHVGLVRLDALDPLSVTVWILPELLMIAGSIFVHVMCNRLRRARADLAEDGSGPVRPSAGSKQPIGFLVSAGKYGVLVAMCFAAVLRPSIIGGLYFLIFLITATWWSCCKQLRKGFAIMLRILMVVVFVHMGTLYAYQFEWPQEFLDKNSTYARYFGLTPIISIDEGEARRFVWAMEEWATYVNPIVLFVLYYILAIQSKVLLNPQLIRAVSPAARRYGSGVNKDKNNVLQDSTGSVTVTGEHPEDIPLEQLEEAYEPTFLENVMFVFEKILNLIIKSSYVGTNIIMMAWSITYLSWITFVLLLWANLLWLVPNQRKSMLRSSPFLVIYAWFLLISAYIYSMNLTEEELPSVIQNINLAQIGFVKVKHLPCNPLMVKCLFTTMFWVNLRQYVQDLRMERQSTALADMVSPLQVTVGAATAGTKQEDSSATFNRFGDIFYGFLTKFWIWIVAITLFGVAITGERMTGFRILYMALFLFFVLTFQMSFHFWRKMMFAFWLTVIVYSMIILVMVYTYQFDHFQDYWNDYLHISLEQQLDIGLEKFDTKQLFVRLVTPTFFVIITVIQLHYFHKDFLILSDPKNVTPIGRDLDESSLQGGMGSVTEKDDTNTSSIKYEENLTASQRFEAILKWAQHILNLIYIFLELHMPKIVLSFLMLLCIFDKNAIYSILILFIVLACTFGRAMTMIAIYSSSLLVSIMLIARMIFQIEYINPNNWNTTCNLGNETVFENNANWFGFVKTNDTVSLPHLVRWNIVFILVVTLMSVVMVRQFNYRVSRGRPTTRAFFMFPKITRADADKDIFSLFKYLMNYGFFKFGIEICLMATVALIGFRMDMYALFYAIWLCILFKMQRKTLAKIWNFYLVFIAVFLLIQYVMTIGLPPTLCLVFPWDSEFWNSDQADIVEMMNRFHYWAYLFDNQAPPAARKLTCDFLLLLLVSRQSVVFRIEKRYEGQEYPGGSNGSILHHTDENKFVNPVNDFITHVCSYLDVLKRGILMSHIWITLAIVFLAGTNRVNIFSIGYLCGAFIFLWQGSDLYLRPVPKILVLWNGLLTYNVCVILVKTSLQIVGCIFINQIPNYSCWMVQLLGIGCVDKFHNLMQASQVDPKECIVPREYVGLVWDGLCFGFLISQKRIFQSYNFFHMVNEIKATTILASRGAELIEELRLKRMNEQEELEHAILEKIKAKMDKIKANQERIQGSFKEPADHFADTLFKRTRHRRRTPKTYKAAVRSGDYYMFDDLDDDENDCNFMDQIQKDDDDDDPTNKKTKPTVGELLSTALKTDISTTLKYQSDLELKRRLSMPLARQRSQRSQISIPFSAPPTIHEYGPHTSGRTVTIMEHREDDEPQPGTSKEEDISDIVTSPRPEITLKKRLLNIFWFIWAFIESLMISATNILNRYTKDYRYVIRVLHKEKKLLKETTDYNTGLRLGKAQVWQPSGSYHSLLKHSREHESSKNLYEFEATEMSSYDQPTIIRLLLAIWHIILCHSELLCYFVIFLNQMKSATFLSLSLPLMVFFWGTLTIPRPDKNFWVTIIAYTEVIVLIKCCFQFDIIPWNMNQAITNNPFYPPRILGIERQPNYAVWDLLLLLVVFFHRFMLKSMGLWQTSIVPGALMEKGTYKVYASGEMKRLDSDPKLKSNEKITIQSESSDFEPLVAHDDIEDDHHPIKLKEDEISTEMDKIISVHTETVQICDDFPANIQMATSKYADGFKQFFRQLRDPTSRVAADVYSYMFLCDFFNFFVILIGYSSFGAQQGDGGVSSYLEDNRVPVLFLLMLILQFMLIIIDRGIFLRKNIAAKIIFQFVQVFILHIWLFIIFPKMTEKSFNSVLPPQMYYMVKCFYLLLSAYQIRCGYPTRILGNFLCKGYNYANMFLFKIFMAIPFLFELRTVMDWMWTDTSMTVFDWIKMEDIFAHIFQLKCNRQAEDEYPQPRGEKKNLFMKYLVGGGILAVIIAIIWFPLVFFSLGNAVGTANLPYDVTLEIRIGPYEPVYMMSAQNNSIYAFSDANLNQLINVYAKHRYAATFISNYEAKDIAAVKLSADSANIWSISPPDRKRMVEEVNSTKPLTVRLEYKVSHKTSKPEDSGIIHETVEIVLPPETPEVPNVNRQNLLQMLVNQSSQIPPVILKQLLPKFLKITNRGTAKPIEQLMFSEITDDQSTSLRTVSLSLNTATGASAEPKKEWWHIQEDCNDMNYNVSLRLLPYVDCESIILYTFNDKIFPATLSIITGGGIVGLYTTLVFLASRFLRGFFADQCVKIMFEDMPNIDRVLQLCLDIYLVREAREFELEEDLFAKLVFLFRSPETLIKWTRPKEEDGDEDVEGDE